MNRRTFTASLAALAATPALPARATSAALPASVPPGAYAWAQLIARAQNKCSPAMLMQHLHLSKDAARALFDQMVRDGVLQAPGMASLARAADPLQTTGAEKSVSQRLTDKLADWAQTPSREERSDDEPPLVKTDKAGLGCADPAPEDEDNASPYQHPERSSQKG